MKAVTKSLFLKAGFILLLFFAISFLPVSNEGNKGEAALSFSLEEAKEKAAYDSREIQRLQLQKDKLGAALDLAKEQQEDMDTIEEVSQLRKELEKEKRELEKKLEELELDWDDFNREENGNGEGFPPEDNFWPEEELEVIRENFEVMQEMIELNARLEMIDSTISLLDSLPGEGYLEQAVLEGEEAKRELEQQQKLLELEIEKARKLLSFAAESLYMQGLVLQEEIRVQGKTLEQLSQVLKEEKRKLELEESLPVIVDGARLEKEGVKQNKAVLEGQLSEIKEELLDLLDLGLDTPFEFKDVEVTSYGYHKEPLLQKALLHGKEIEIARKEMDFARDNKDWAIDHYGSGSHQARIKEAELKEAIHGKEDAKNSVRRSLAGAFRSLDQAERQLKLAGKAVELQEEMLRGQELQTEIGMGTSYDKTDALLEKDKSLRQKEQSRLQVYLAQKQVELAAEGIILDDHENNNREGAPKTSGEGTSKPRGEDSRQENDFPGTDEPGFN